MQAEKQHDKWLLSATLFILLRFFIGADFQHAMLIFSSFFG